MDEQRYKIKADIDFRFLRELRADFDTAFRNSVSTGRAGYATSPNANGERVMRFNSSLGVFMPCASKTCQGCPNAELCKRKTSTIRNNYKEFFNALSDGFKAMVPAMLILTFAWTLSGVTGQMGATVFVAEFVRTSASHMANFLPAIVFLIGTGLAFATGTSWGTFGILIPIVLDVFPAGSELAVIGMSACLAGAVCGDHCSPISDTTIMASAGGQCNHLNHVQTQLPYAITCAVVSFVAYVFAGFVQNVVISLIFAFVLMAVVLVVAKALHNKKVKA